MTKVAMALRTAVVLLFCFVALLQRSAASAVSNSARLVEELNRYAESMQVDDSCPTSGAMEVCQSALLEGANDASSYFTICPDDGDSFSEKVCYYSTIPCCSATMVRGLTGCNSTSTLQVAGKEIQVTLLNLLAPGSNIPSQVCFEVDPTDIEPCIADCKPDCVSTAPVCFENTINGDTSSCTGGTCQCKEGYLQPDCCECNTRTHYGPNCKPFCPDNCRGINPLFGGCLECQPGYETSPECCDCAPGFIQTPQGCQTRGEPECGDVDLYFLIDATISFDYLNFCKSMAITQILTAAFNPSSSSSIKTSALLFPLSSGDKIEQLYDFSDTCSDIVDEKLPTIIADFAFCKSGDFQQREYERLFISVCDGDTNALKGFKQIAEVAKTRQARRRAVITLTDGTNSDTNQEMNNVRNGLLKDAGITTLIAARCGTNFLNEGLMRYADKEENAVVDKSIIKLTRKIVDRLFEENVICETVANDVIRRLNALQEEDMQLMPYYCNCVPDKQAGKPPCSLAQYTFKITYPTCGGALDVGVKLVGPTEQVAEEKVKTNTNVMEEEILAAVEQVLNSYHD